MDRTQKLELLKRVDDTTLISFAQAVDYARCDEREVSPTQKEAIVNKLLALGATEQEAAEAISLLEQGVEGDGYEWVWDEELAC